MALLACFCSPIFSSFRDFFAELRGSAKSLQTLYFHNFFFAQFHSFVKLEKNICFFPLVCFLLVFFCFLPPPSIANAHQQSPFLPLRWCHPPSSLFYYFLSHSVSHGLLVVGWLAAGLASSHFAFPSPCRCCFYAPFFQSIFALFFFFQNLLFVLAFATHPIKIN